MNDRRRQARIRVSAVWCVAICALWLFTLPSTALADSPIRVIANSHSYVFGQELRFHLQAAGSDPIQSIILAYQTSDEPRTVVETLDIDPGLQVDADYVHRIPIRYVRPFANVTYWWTIETATQARLITEPQSFVYADDRFDWQALEGDSVTLHWHHGEIDVAQKALDSALAGVNRALLDVPVGDSAQAIHIYLYSDKQELLAALPGSVEPDSEALTLYDASVILVARDASKDSLLDLKRILPHEVTHALLHTASPDQRDHVPTWLAEGLATSIQYEFDPNPDAKPLVEQAIQNQRTIPLDTLCGAFPQDRGQAMLAYAQSASLIDYIRDIHGRQALRDLIAAYSDGATCEGGVQRVLGVSQEHLLSQWAESLVPRSAWSAFWQDNGGWVILVLLFALLPLGFALPWPAPHSSRGPQSAESSSTGLKDHKA